MGTVHVAIVDPTVGSNRRSIILSKDQHFFVGPDNGIFTLIMGDDPEVYLIENPSFMLKVYQFNLPRERYLCPGSSIPVKGGPAFRFWRTYKRSYATARCVSQGREEYPEG